MDELTVNRYKWNQLQLEVQRLRARIAALEAPPSNGETEVLIMENSKEKKPV